VCHLSVIQAQEIDDGTVVAITDPARHEHAHIWHVGEQRIESLACYATSLGDVDFAGEGQITKAKPLRRARGDNTQSRNQQDRHTQTGQSKLQVTHVHVICQPSCSSKGGQRKQRPQGLIEAKLREVIAALNHRDGQAQGNRT